jgi:starvation-inducible DNA-binding protein
MHSRNAHRANEIFSPALERPAGTNPESRENTKKSHKRHVTNEAERTCNCLPSNGTDGQPRWDIKHMKKSNSNKTAELRRRRDAALATRTDLNHSATRDISGAMNAILADVFALYVKTKNFHWHMSGPHFRDYHLLLDEQAGQLFAMTDPIAERVRKIGGLTLHSIGQISRLQRVLDNDAEYVEPLDMLAELADDNKTLAARLRETHNVCDDHRDVATASLIEVWIDETERRTWFLFEACRRRN